MDTETIRPFLGTLVPTWSPVYACHMLPAGMGFRPCTFRPRLDSVEADKGEVLHGEVAVCSVGALEVRALTLQSRQKRPQAPAAGLFFGETPQEAAAGLCFFVFVWEPPVGQESSNALSCHHELHQRQVPRHQAATLSLNIRGCCECRLRSRTNKI